MWWDAAVGWLGAAAVLAVVLDPLLAPALTAHSPATMALAIYPLCDLVLVAAVTGIAALRDVRMGSHWALLVGGLFVFAAAHVTYSLRTASRTFVHSASLDSAWTLGIALVALWVDGSSRDQPTLTTRSAGGPLSLAVSSGATLAGLVVLLKYSPLRRTTEVVTTAGAVTTSVVSERLCWRRQCASSWRFASWLGWPTNAA